MNPGEQYYPSNGSEGCYFTDKFCSNCIHEKFMHTNNEDHVKCDILSNSMLGPVEEWVYDHNDEPSCTKFKKFDWGNDDDEGGLNEPPELPPDDPNQLMLPFILDEIGVNQLQNQLKEV